MMRHSLTLLALALAGLLAACMPVVQPAGPFEGTARVVPAPDGAGTGTFFEAGDGAILPLRVWGEGEAAGGDTRPRAVIAALHGFNDYGHAFEAAARDWAARGILTYAIDQRGFGEAPQPGIWPGAATLTRDAADLITSLRRRHPEAPVYLLGHSLGAAVAIETVVRQGPRVAGLILVAPATWGGDSMNVFYRASLWLGAHTFPGLKLTGRRLGRQASDNLEMLRALGRDPLFIKETRVDAVYGAVNLMGRALESAGALSLPTLLLYGERDEIIPRQSFEALRARLAGNGHLRVAVYETGWHMLMRDLAAETVRQDVAAFVLDPGGELPSGAEMARRE